MAQMAWSRMDWNILEKINLRSGHLILALGVCDSKKHIVIMSSRPMIMYINVIQLSECGFMYIYVIPALNHKIT